MRKSFYQAIAIALVAFGFVACGEKTPQEIRADFDEKMEEMFVDGLRGQFSKDELKCAAKTMSSFFSDEELQTLYGASWGQMTMADNRMTEENIKFYSVNNKLQSRFLIQRALASCIK